jgi:hypothetical protein
VSVVSERTLVAGRRRSRTRAASIAIAGVVLAAVAGLTGACGSAASLVPQGGECFAATDCAAGLVCIPRKDGTRACDSDLSSVEKPATGAGTDAGAPAVDAAPADDATTSPDASTPRPDAGAKDAAPPRDATPPPVDAGVDADDAAIPADAAAD